jgi:two-component system sensor histidine kinase UhpB
MIETQPNRTERRASRPLRVLLVEDSEEDAMLIQMRLRQPQWSAQCKRVQDESALRQALEKEEWDLIISDYVIPGFSGLHALEVVRELDLDIPFIVVSGMIGEETAVAAMKAGAHDYLMKDNLARLVPAIERELREAETRRARRISEQKLKLEHTFRKAIENSIPSGIAVMDLSKVQTYVNPSFCAMVGWSEGDLIGTRPPFVYWPEEERKKIEACFATAFKGKAPANGFELRFCKRDGTRFDALVFIAALLDANGKVTGWVRSVTDITQRKKMEEALRHAHDELEERVQERTAELGKALQDLRKAVGKREKLEQDLLEIAEEQRVLNALELHDDLGQRLAGISLVMKGLENKVRRGKALAPAELERISSLMHEAISGNQDVSAQMEIPTMTGEDLVSAMKGLTRFFKGSQKIACTFEAKGTIPVLARASVVHLYRIALEAIANAIKHSKAKRIQVLLTGKAGELVLRITSNGLPFPDLSHEKSGMGLRIMNYRASLLNASLKVAAGKGEGTVVTCDIPISRERAA